MVLVFIYCHFLSDIKYMLRLQFHDVIFLKTNYYYLMTAMVSLNIKYRFFEYRKYVEQFEYCGIF